MAGIYIHIPFCKQACTYCNFHFSTSLAQKENLLSALNNEIALATSFDSNDVIKTIYIGGGTPSLLTSGEIASIYDSISKKFKIAPDVEFTLEANPDDINSNILQEWIKLGINRLSLGIQSFAEPELVWMNRAHNATESLKSIELIQAAGFENFSVDLIYGSPLLSDEQLEKNLAIIFEKNIPHISCYALTVEPKTALNKLIEQKKLPLIDPEKQASQFLLIMQRMKEHGYEHYEISNFAKPGMRSKHNSSYWQGQSYYGFGPSAHSFDGKNTRRWNVANNALYIQSLQKNIIPFEEEILTPTQQLNEYIMTALRTTEGINLKLAGDNAAMILMESKKYIDSGKLVLKDDFLILTNEGKLFADGIAADLFF